LLMGASLEKGLGWDFVRLGIGGVRIVPWTSAGNVTKLGLVSDRGIQRGGEKASGSLGVRRFKQKQKEKTTLGAGRGGRFGRT